MTGHIKEYVKVADGDRVYELFVTDDINPELDWSLYKGGIDTQIMNIIS